MLRLSLSGDMKNNPGFYQITHTLATFWRIARKSPDLIPMWKMRHITFEGRLLPGPFTKLVTCLNKIGWSISDPLQVQDHEQHEWHLVNVDEKTPHALLMDVWCQHLASQRPCATLWAWIQL